MSLNIYNPTTQQLTEVAGLDVKDSLEKVATLPTPTADYLNQVYILVGTQEGYHVGSIYQCRYINSAYTWVEITGSVVGKADKAPNATNNHLAKLTADGNLADSGIAVGDLGTAINKDWTDLVRPNSHDLVESNAVYSAITNAISSIYTPHGDITCAELVPALLIEENIGNVYTVTDSGTTTAYFMQGAGKTINTGDSVSIIKAGEDTILFNLMGNVLDLTDYQKKNLTTAIEIGGVNKTTVESALNGLNDHEEEDIENIYKFNGKVGGHNLWNTASFREYTQGGITYTSNADGSVTTAGGTTTGESLYPSLALNTLLEEEIIDSCDLLPNTKYIVSFGNDIELSDNIRIQVYYKETVSSSWVMLGQQTDGKSMMFTTPSSFYMLWARLQYRIAGITVPAMTFYPMIRIADDSDSTWQPYAPTNNQLASDIQIETDNNNHNGAKNTFFATLSHNGTYGGIDYVTNADGTLTFNGTATANSYLLITVPTDLTFAQLGWEANKTYTASLEISEVINKTIQFGADRRVPPNLTYINRFFEPSINAGATRTSVNFTISSTDVANGYVARMWIYYPSGTVFDNLVLKPMIRLATISDNTWVEPAETNRQLTINKFSHEDNKLAGTKNLLPILVNSGVQDGITYTVNSNGSITLSGTHTTSGENTAIGLCYRSGLANNPKIFLNNGIYILSGVTDGKNKGVSLRLGVTKSGTFSNIITSLTDGEKVFNINGEDNYTYGAYIQVQIDIASTADFSTPITIYPMIRVADDSDGTYVKGIMTNTQLMDEISGIVKLTSWTPKIYDYETYKFDGNGYYFRIGDLGIAKFSFPPQSQDVTFSLMLQVRNCPFKRVIGGQIFYPSNLDSDMGGQRTVQYSESIIGGAYFRPNITGTFASTSPQSISGLLFGYFAP